MSKSPSRAIVMVRALAGAVLLFAGASAPAAAQDQGHLAPPTPRRSDTSPPTLWNYFAIVVIVGSVVVANCIPSKRGHQD